MHDATFRTKVIAAGGRALIVLPFDPDATWGRRARHDVTGTIGGHAYRGKVERTAHGAVLSLGPAWRRDTGVKVGDEVEVRLSPEGPQIADMGDDVVAAFDADPEARATFEGLNTFCRNNYARWIAEAKRPDTRARRIAAMMQMLRENPTARPAHRPERTL